MARDIEADAVINDKSAKGLRSFEKNIRDTNKKVEKEYDRFGKETGEKLLAGIGAISPELAKSLASGVGDAAKLGAPVLIAGIAAAAPFISGLIGAAVQGGAAGGGIVGGVALATRDSRVKAAGAQLGQNLLLGLQDKAGSFIDPVLKSVDLLQAKFAESGDTLQSIFDNSSKFVVPLVDSVGTAIQSLLNGVDMAVGQAGPVMDALNQGIITVGSSVEMLLGNLSNSAEGNAAALNDMFEAISGVVAIVGPLIESLSTVYGWLDQIGLTSNLLVNLDKIFNGTDEAAMAAADALERQNDVMQRGGLTVEQLEQDTQAYNKALEDNAKAAEDALNAQQSLFSSITNYGAALDAAQDSAKKNGKTLDENTEKGRANRESLDRLAGGYKRVIDEQIKTGASSDTVAAKQSSLRKQFYDVALSMTGSAKKAQELTNKLLGIPSPKPKVTLNTANVASQARNAREEIAQIKGKTVTVTVNVNASRLNKVENQLARLQKSGYYADGLSYAPAAPGQGGRTGGAAGLTATIENVISLDGVPFRSYTQDAITRREGERRFRERVGRR